MLIVRLVMVVLTAALLSGAACAPVYSDRPVGVRPVDFAATPVAWNGVWCTPSPDWALAAPVTTLSSEQGLYCWTVSVADEAGGILSLRRLFDKNTDPKVIQLHVREAQARDPHQGFSGFMFLSEEDTVLKGSYLWALASIRAQDQLLVWMTEGHREDFVGLVASQQLPGRIVEQREGKSGVWSLDSKQTVILGDLQADHLELIFERRGALFDFEPWIIQRVPPTEPILRDKWVEPRSD